MGWSDRYLYRLCNFCEKGLGDEPYRCKLTSKWCDGDDCILIIILKYVAPIVDDTIV